MKIFLLVLTLLFASLARAADPDIFVHCEFGSDDWKGTIVVDLHGFARLDVIKAATSERSTCAARVDYIRYGKRDLAPNLTLLLVAETCPAADLGAQLLEHMVLIINTLDIKRPRGRLKWNRSRQPDDCAVQRLDLDKL